MAYNIKTIRWGIRQRTRSCDLAVKPLAKAAGTRDKDKRQRTANIVESEKKCSPILKEICPIRIFCIKDGSFLLAQSVRIIPKEVVDFLFVERETMVPHFLRLNPPHLITIFIFVELVLHTHKFSSKDTAISSSDQIYEGEKVYNINTNAQDKTRTTSRYPFSYFGRTLTTRKSPRRY